MTEDQHWEIIKLARIAAGGSVERQAELIARQLGVREVPEIVTFNRWLQSKMHDACQSHLLIALEWIYSTRDLDVSGDSWEYHRAWLVGRGREEYHAALRNPDALADYFTTPEEFFCGEEIELAPHKAYEIRTGRRECPEEMYEPFNIECWPAIEPDVDRTPEKLVVRFPRLARKFGPPRIR